MNKLSKLLVFSLLLAIMYSCSAKKDAFLNRNFHALTTKFNVLFNGEQAYLKGLEDAIVRLSISIADKVQRVEDVTNL